MKLRIENDTLRLRLADDEVQTFAATGRVSAATHFGPTSSQQLSYSLERTERASSATEPAEKTDSQMPTLRYAPGQITVLVPAALADEWTSTDRTGFSGEILVSETAKLRILVEKDLDCKH